LFQMPAQALEILGEKLGKLRQAHRSGQGNYPVDQPVQKTKGIKKDFFHFHPPAGIFVFTANIRLRQKTRFSCRKNRGGGRRPYFSPVMLLLYSATTCQISGSSRPSRQKVIPFTRWRYFLINSSRALVALAFW